MIKDKIRQKILIINADYPEFLEDFYKNNPNLKNLSYNEQMKARNESLFGVADFYSRNFNECGYEARELHINNEILQRQWAKENGLKLSVLERPIKKSILVRLFKKVKEILKKAPFCQKLKEKIGSMQTVSKPTPALWVQQILREQIRVYNPDAILNQAMDYISGELLNSIKHHTQIIVGQIAAPLPKGEDYSGYDIIFSSLPNFVNKFRQWGIRSELNKLAFEPRILDFFDEKKKESIEVAFIGGITADHLERLKLMEIIGKAVDIKIWGRADKSFLNSKASSRFQNINGPLWGIDMYKVLNKSKIIVNQHIDIAGNFANNMRLYEATGMGCLLITDWKENITELFEPDKEIVTYRTPEECVEKISYYLNHEEERKKIALAGQRRTLSEHNYRNRVSEMLKVIEKNYDNI